MAVLVFSKGKRTEHNRPLVTLRWTDRDEPVEPLAAD